MVSKITKPMQAMKMKKTFCVSPRPNQTSVRGIRAAIGTLRRKSVIGFRNDSTLRKQPARIPSGMPTRAARPKPKRMRRRLHPVLRLRAASNHRLLMCPTTSPGLGRVSGESTRPSGGPQVRAAQTTTSRRTARSWSASPQSCGTGRRRTMASAVLQGEDLDLHPPVQRVVALLNRLVPAHAVDRELVGLQVVLLDQLLLDRVGAVHRQLLD